jgi:hypothetical protein
VTSRESAVTDIEAIADGRRAAIPVNRPRAANRSETLQGWVL